MMFNTILCIIAFMFSMVPSERVKCLSLQVEDAVSRAADGTSAVQDLDFSSLRSQLGPLAAVSVQNSISSLFKEFSRFSM